MATFSVAVIGTGPDPDNIVWGKSAAMAYQHGNAYAELPQCELVACADIVRENAEAFAERFDLPADNVYESYDQMLSEVEPDIVSVCTPVPTHADIVKDVAETDIPVAIHCEKPMADTWDGAQSMTAVAAEHDVQLTFNHQRRFHPAWRGASDLLDEEVIGKVNRVEIGGKNIFDFGSHFIDLCNHYVGERRAEWVICQVDYRTEDVRYGTHNENHSIATWAYDDDTFGFASTGVGWGDSIINAGHRIIGEYGQIEVHPKNADVALRYRSESTDGWVNKQVEEEFAIKHGIDHICSYIESGEQPVLSAEHALRATEIMFGAYESARQRARISLPPEAGGNALTEMVESGQLNPTPESES